MLFNSYEFIYVFLPIAVGVFFAVSAYVSNRVAVAWLVFASLFFYGWWNPKYLPLIGGSIVVNYFLSRLIMRRRDAEKSSASLVALGVTANLALLGYFKYANWMMAGWRDITGSTSESVMIVLPIAISFFTFQQIAYLVDVHRGEAREYRFLHYTLFVTFFPQLIAGPIVHHREMMPQFLRDATYKLKSSNLAIGCSIFFIGLFKKVIIADGIAPGANELFDAVDAGFSPSFLEAWMGALAYTFQLYFDFSGYSDMAIGLARLFGIRLPLNFYSPYKAASIIEFWRCWHITLSRFLRDYLYIPLGGGRNGVLMRYRNLMFTMLLGALWHGAGLTFVIWGALHGLYLVLNHTWRRLVPRGRINHSWQVVLACRGLTMASIAFAWVFFRAESTDAAVRICASMLGFNGFALPDAYQGRLLGLEPILLNLGIEFTKLPHFHGVEQIGYLMALIMIVWILPNTYQIHAPYRPAFLTYREQRRARKLLRFFTWSPSVWWSVITSLLALVTLYNMMEARSEFLYFDF